MDSDLWLKYKNLSRWSEMYFSEWTIQIVVYTLSIIINLYLWLLLTIFLIVPFKNFFAYLCNLENMWTPKLTELTKLQDKKVSRTDWVNNECGNWIDLYHGWKEVLDPATNTNGISGFLNYLELFLLQLFFFEGYQLMCLVA